MAPTDSDRARDDQPVGATVQCANYICTVTVDANWLNANSELPVCLAQPELVGKRAIAGDESRPQSLELADAIFANEGGQSRLARWFRAESGLLLFPEYAFGSTDFGQLDALVRAYPHPLIVIGGFGIVDGNGLRGILRHCDACWPEGADAIDPQSRYNGGWCWIHSGPGSTSCYVFLKNFFEQRLEITAGLTEGTHILRVDTRDLVLYPLICADLVSNQANSPRARIARSLLRTPGDQPEINKRVLVAALLYTHKPYDELWRQAINYVVELDARSAGLCTVNQLICGLEEDVERDKWRSFSGGFIHNSIMRHSPLPPLPNVRFVNTDSASGLVLRQSGIGIACGRFLWVSSADEGFNVLAPNVRRLLKQNAFSDIGDSVESQELKRYVRRRSGAICGRYHQSSNSLVASGLEEIAAAEDENYLTPRLWSKLLTGVEERAPIFDAEKMNDESVHLEPALGVFASIQQTTGAEPLTGPPHSGQLRWNEHELLVWSSPRHDPFMVLQLLKRSALDRPGEPMLVVIGSGSGGYIGACKIEPERRSDISASVAPGDITSSRARSIYWRPLADIENTLIDPHSSVEQKRTAIVHQLTIS